MFASNPCGQRQKKQIQFGNSGSREMGRGVAIDSLEILRRTLSREKRVLRLVLRIHSDRNEENHESCLWPVVLFGCLRQNACLEELSLYLPKGGIRDIDISWVALVLVINENLKKLDLSCNQLSLFSSRFLSHSLSFNSTLQTLNLSCNDLPPPAIVYLADMLVGNRALKSLDLSFNDIEIEGVRHLAVALRINTTLEDLNIAGTNIGCQPAVESLQMALAENSTLQVLNVSSNTPHGAAPGDLATILLQNRHVKVFNLSDSNLNLRSVSNLVRIHPALNTLEMDNMENANAIGLRELQEPLQYTQTLEQLSLCGCGLDDEQAEIVAGILATNKSLKEVYISGNEIGEIGAVHLAGALESNDTLPSIVLSYNAIGTTGGASFGRMLERNKSLRVLDLTKNLIGPGAGAALAEGLAGNTGLERLVLTGNRVGDEGGEMIVEALFKNETLRELSLGDNGTADKTALRLAQAISREGSELRKLHLEGASENLSDDVAEELVHCVLQSRLEEFFVTNGPPDGEDEVFLRAVFVPLLDKHSLTTDVNFTPEMQFHRYLNNVGVWKLLQEEEETAEDDDDGPNGGGTPLSFWPLVIANLCRPMVDRERWDLEMIFPGEESELDVLYFLLRNKPDIFRATRNTTERREKRKRGDDPHDFSSRTMVCR